MNETNSSLTLTVYTDNLEEKRSELAEKLQQHNVKKIGKYKHNNILFLYRNENSEFIAGLYAWQSFGRLFIDILWVDEKYRKKGIGSNLLKKAEDHATKSGALYIELKSGSFEAPSFYAKHGYEIFAKLPLKTKNLENQFNYYFIKYLDQSNLQKKSSLSGQQLDSVIVRQANINDMPKILPLLEQLGYPQENKKFQQQFSQFLSQPDYGIAVAVCRDNLAGLIAWSKSMMLVSPKNRLRIEGLIVDKDYRHQSIGKSLIKYLEEFAKSIVPCVIEVTSGLRREGDGSHDFYRALNYQNKGLRAKAYFRKDIPVLS